MLRIRISFGFTKQCTRFKMTTARRGLARVRSRKRERGDKRRGAEPEGAERFACVCALGEGSESEL